MTPRLNPLDIFTAFASLFSFVYLCYCCLLIFPRSRFSSALARSSLSSRRWTFLWAVSAFRRCFPTPLPPPLPPTWSPAWTRPQRAASSTAGPTEASRTTPSPSPCRAESARWRSPRRPGGSPSSSSSKTVMRHDDHVYTQTDKSKI